MRRESFWAGLFVLSGCAGPLASPADGGRPWRELRSRHFVLQSNVAEDVALHLVRELEQAYELFDEIAFPYPSSIETTTRVAVFHGLSDLEPLGMTAGGMFMRESTGRWDIPPIIVLPGGDWARSRTTFQHELCHRFVGFYYPAAPVWLNEGLCEYYSTVEFDAHGATLGRYLNDRSFSRDFWGGFHRRDGGVYVVMPADEVPPLAELMTADSRVFYAHGNADLDAAAKQRALYYGGAWAAVHLLQSLPEGRTRWKRYLDALHAGVESEHAAFTASYGDLSQAELEQAFRSFLVRHETELVRVPFRAAALPPVSVSPLSVARTHLLLASTRNRSKPEQARQADEDLERAVSIDPNDPEVYRARGLQRVFDGDYARAEADLRQAVELAPNDPRFIHPLAQFYADELHGPANAHRAAFDRLFSRLVRLAKSSAQLDFVARVLLKRGNGGGARRFADKALRADFMCASCLETLAMVAEYRDDLKAAVSLQTLAVNLTVHGSDLERMVTRLEHYRKELARCSARAQSSE